MTDRSAVIEAGSEMIRLMMKPTNADPTALVQRFRETVFTTHEFVDLEITPTFALVFTMTEEFAELSGTDLSPLLGMDHKAWDDIEWWAQELCTMISIDADFSWDAGEALRRHQEGGLSPVPLGMIALDDWMAPRGFRFIRLDDGSDAYHGFPVRLDCLDRMFALGDATGIRLSEPGEMLRAHLARVEASAKRPRFTLRRRR